MELLKAIQLNSYSDTPRTALATSRTSTILHGSFLPFRTNPSVLLFLLANLVLTSFAPAWEFLIQQQGASVSSMMRSKGITLRVSRFSCVLKLHPFIPIYKSNSTICLTSSTPPVKECTTPVLNLSLFLRTMSQKSEPVFRLCRYMGSFSFQARSKWKGKTYNCCYLEAQLSLSQSKPHQPIATNLSFIRTAYVQILAMYSCKDPYFYLLRGSAARHGWTPIVQYEFLNLLQSSQLRVASQRQPAAINK